MRRLTSSALLTSTRMTTRTLLRAAGLVAWAFAGIPAVWRLATDATCTVHGTLPPWGVFTAWGGAFVVFGVSFWRVSAAAGEVREDRQAQRLVGFQSLAALTMLTLLCTGFESSLLVVVAVELGFFFSMRLALGWLLVQSALLSMLAMRQMGWPQGAFWTIGAIGFETFAFTVACIAGREAAARRALARANAELEAARDRVATLARDAERLRIARELHDLLGHELVALHLNLEAAKHLPGAEAVDSIGRAQVIAKGLLGDVRKAVGVLRGDGPVDVTAELRAITANVKVPRVHLDAPSRLDLDDADRANTIVRCVQEIVTNTRKHASAANLWIEIVPGDHCLEVHARDDGQGAHVVAPGNGLSGMRERLARLDGALSFDGRSGFRVRAMLPLSTTHQPAASRDGDDA